MTMRKQQGSRLKRASAAAVAALTLWTVSTAAMAATPSDAVRSLREEGALVLLRLERADLLAREELSLPGWLALRAVPLLRSRRAPDDAAQDAPDRAPEEPDSSVSPAPDAPPPLSGADNGLPARTLRPAGTDGYLARGSVLVANAGAAALTEADLEGAPTAVLTGDAPQVLIVHTHGSEAYTMPPGEEYVPSDDHRTTDKSYNVVRVGDEIERVLTEAGIGVIHDRELYDYPQYSGAYGRSLAAIERRRAEYPSLVFILDVHRDAMEDADGRQLRTVCAERPDTAQMEFVIGSDGGGADHPRWRENLRLASAVQETLLADYPTLMRPITVRSSRYNQHVSTGSLLLEVGAAGNTLDEALAAARLFAEGFAAALQG